MALVEFLSPEWIEEYKTIIRGGAEGEDLSGVEFGMYEHFKNVPPRFRHGRGPDICFGFCISNGQLEFRDQPWDSAAIKIVADFESAAPWVDLPLESSSAAGVNARLMKAGKLRISGNIGARPKFMDKLAIHDSLAKITAPYVNSSDWES